MDKFVTRMAALGRPRVLLFGRWWDLEAGARYRVQIDKVPATKVLGVRIPGGLNMSTARVVRVA